MGQIEDLRLFVAVVDTGSISRAADQMNIAKSAVSRRLGLLEDRFGARLIDRGPGVWAVTSTGRELYQRAQRTVHDVDDITSDFSQDGSNLAGPLSISVPREFGTSFLMPALIAFQTRHPEIHLSVDFEDRSVDLLRENYDLAIRISVDTQAGVVAQQIGKSAHYLLAAPSYLAQAGHPVTPNDLQDHALLYYGQARRAVWTFQSPKGKPQSIEFQPALNSNSGTFLAGAAEQGLGIVLAPDFLVQRQLDQGTLVKVLADIEIQDRGIFLVHAEDRRINKRMRLFSDEMKTACSPVFKSN
jgi:DNA-binding transcriptional LysR family regulator